MCAGLGGEVTTSAVLVTGASGGIGSTLVAALASAGHRVIAVGRDADRLQRLAARTIVADLAQVDQLTAAVGELAELNALVHCAGVSEVAAVADTQLASWQHTLTVNVTAAAELTRLALPALRRSRGHVVFVNAAPGLRAVPRWSAFVASKVALRELADSLREEEAVHGLRVTTVYPGGTATERLRRTRAAFGRPYDPAQCIQPGTLAAMIVWVLAAPADAYVSELAVLPAPHLGESQRPARGC
jgi:NADP-dependent 3-hydroxy acid dehydrogenase YdfG